MDAKTQELEDRLGEILKHAADVASQIQQHEQGPGTPHYDQIESAAHDVGQRLSRLVQQDRTGEVSAAHATQAACPECRNKCPVEPQSRQVTSVDGPVELIESVAFCSQCRRSFFPSTHRAGV